MRKSSRIGLLALGCAALMMVGSAGRAEQQPPAAPVVSPMQQTAFERLRTATQLMQMGAAGQMKEVAIADTEYKIIRQAYVNDQIIINYPQVTGLSDRRKQEKINALINKEAMYWLDQYTEEQLGRLTLETNCEIKVQMPEVLSIVYSGYSYLRGAAHPIHVFHTTNVDMRDGSRIRIKDIAKIDDAFAAKILAGRYFLISPKVPLDRIKPSPAELAEALRTADWLGYPQNRRDTYTYFTGDALGVSISFAHVYGNHAEIEIPYEAIAEYMNAESKLWERF